MIVMMQFKKKQLNGSTKEDVAKNIWKARFTEYNKTGKSQQTSPIANQFLQPCY
jgi:hypothetical protein